MRKLVDKLLLLGMCLLALSLTDVRWLSVVVMLGAVAISALNSYFENRLPTVLSLAYIAICIFVPEFIIFLPLMAYDLSGMDKWAVKLSWLAALPSCVAVSGWQVAAAVALTSCAALALQQRTSAFMKIQNALYELTDDAKEKAAFLEDRNRELTEKQDYEVRIATLAERNRIAREIHDNVGHLLTRSILQISAMLISDRDTQNAVKELHSVKSTLAEAMDSIRNSVHDLHDESVNLHLQLQSIINAFTFCPVKLRYDAGELATEVRICFAAVVRESLSNIAKHSKATEATVAITEHPAFCQLVVWDNGAPGAKKGTRGIGLRNMEDRVNALGGIFRAEHDKGFKVFASVPAALEFGIRNAEFGIKTGTAP